MTGSRGIDDATALPRGIAAFKEFGEKARHTAISVGEASAAVGQVSDGARSQSAALSQVATAC